MASGTVAYTDTRGNKDYLGTIASQIGRRLKQASNMAAEERAFAESQAEKNNTSLAEAGIGRGHFFKRALGSRFGGDRIARTRGRLGAQGPGTDPTRNYKQRFRGGFDYNYSEQINQVTQEIGGAIVPMSSALSTGLRGVEGGLVQVSQSISSIGVAMGQLAVAQQDLARQAMMNGAFMRAFMTYMQRQQSRAGASREERLLEGGRRRLGGRGGPINITPGGGGFGKGGPSGGLLKGLDTAQTVAKLGSNYKGISQTAKGAQTVAGFGAENLAKAGFRAPTTVGRMITKEFANAALSKTAVKTGAKSVDAVVGAGKLLAKKPIVKTLKPGVQMLTNVGAKEVTNAAKTFDALDAASDAAKADAFAKGMAELGLEDDLVAKALSNTGDIKVPQKAAAKFFHALRNGLVDGTKRTTEQALAASRFLLGDAQYKRLLKGADKPIGKALEGTVTDGLLKGVGKNAGKMAGKGVLKSVLKKIPIIAGIAGIGFGIQRALEGDFLGAGLEITSGLLGATGVGSGLSFGIDGFLLARDMGMMPMAKGGILTQATPVVAGEAGAEGFFPLEGARGRKTFAMFGEGLLQAQKDSGSEYARIQALGHQEYYEGMGGWEKFFKGFGKVFDTLKDSLGNVMYNIFSNIPILKRFVTNPSTSGNGVGGADRPGATAGSDTLNIGGGGGQMNLSDEQYKWLAYAISGEAGPGDDQYAVAASILNRVAEGRGTVEQVVKADGQYEAYEKGMMKMSPEIEARLRSPEGQARMVAALNRLQGRTDFKGQTELRNRVAAEDPMVDKKGNFFHYSWQTGANSVKPSDYRMPNYQQFIKKTNAPAAPLIPPPPVNEPNMFQKWLQSLGGGEQQSQQLNQSSAMASLAPFSLAAPTVINNNYYTQAGSSQTDDSFGAGFSASGFSAYTVPFSLASKA